ncbi:hypothetical protein LAV84_18580 [Rhizobium sp. VS19-DR104.2]|uniref:hypothetical protein n=1 Tax=unclassified Rhizobium TaxID=2613769 RepID=UPI001CC602A8|nr:MULTISPECIES: hypothetical protein [unclassified Rhizobium]MBZ5761526.1 hypothetical protein [Rhizobium sp. VS19-DR96]MBZ5767474.1 hypothetical protein [Rhizobium sp. VS19-DR129.2]MBZ5775077.1 hypothetical protein [Rhizobium sp. VS19-DRK62.2]MBZ5785958.1 hypothetical protein [Rhizobium sp. VS19-DR121]MBZ5803384.1 hypothetical protein [Rhizobium sp. VS19-DR181]
MSEQRSEKEIIDEAYGDEAAKIWRAPVQGYPAGIPWPVHLEAYAAYCKRWSKQTALIDLKGRHCRGGFGIAELDELVPGWLDRVSYIGRLEARIAELEAAKDSPASILSGIATVAVPLSTILSMRDALIAKDVEEAYFHLYQAVDPGFVKFEPWAEIEAALSATATEGE